MYQLNDTIAAVSSTSSDKRVIIRITGPRTTNTIKAVFRPSTGKIMAGVVAGTIAVDSELEVEAKLYLFLSPHSYTGEDVAELHIYTNPSAVEAFMEGLLRRGLRMAGPGEFTARAYMHGKMNLAQAEAVQQIIQSSNSFQLAAAERLLEGRLAQTTRQICTELMDCLGLIEAGIDFSAEDIEFISWSEAAEKLEKIKLRLEKLLAESIRCESVIDLPAVGIAGSPNAGKSSLLNRLLGRQRSIVSQQSSSSTTRDILTGELSLTHCRIVAFDCAGLLPRIEGISNIEQGTPNYELNILDELAQQAAIEALQKALVVVFCFDITKEDWTEDILIRRLLDKFENQKSKIETPPAQPAVIPAATKSDLLEIDYLTKQVDKLKALSCDEPIVVSSRTGEGIETLREVIDSKIIELTVGPAAARRSGLHRGASGLRSHFGGVGSPRRVAETSPAESAGSVATLTARHRGAVRSAIENIAEAAGEMQAGNDEVAAMMLRLAYQSISNIQQHIDEQILEKIFSHFCIGK